MRKRTAVVVGLGVVVASVAVLGYRHSSPPVRPSVTRGAELPHARPALPHVREAVQRRVERNASPEAQGPQGPMSGWQMFDLVINVLNVAIGAAGIWLAVAAGRGAPTEGMSQGMALREAPRHEKVGV